MLPAILKTEHKGGKQYAKCIKQTHPGLDLSKSYKKKKISKDVCSVAEQRVFFITHECQVKAEQF